jgi:zinc and cadmium transporter
MGLAYTVLATFLVSLISFIGAISLVIKKDFLKKWIMALVSFASGTLISGAFLHLIPEAYEKSEKTFINVLIGFFIFFIMEKYFHWRHCHKDEKCEIHPVSYLNLIGDGIHNIFDGILIGVSFTIDIKTGIISTLLIIFHEIPQELGDFGILIYSGLKISKALLLNFVSGLTAIIGGVTGYLAGEKISNFTPLLMAISAGGFIYISASDLVPELTKEKEIKQSLKAVFFFLLGIILMLILKHKD